MKTKTNKCNCCGNTPAYYKGALGLYCNKECKTIIESGHNLQFISRDGKSRKSIMK